MARWMFFTVLILCAGFLSAEPLRVIYMAQAGYDPRDVEQRGREFAEETGIEVAFQFEEYEDIYDLLTGDSGKSGAFDVVLLDNIWTADFADRGILEPVPDNLRSQVEAGVIYPIYSANMYNGELWGVPFLANFQLLYTNMDLLSQAGFDSPPRTLEEMRHMADTAKEKGVIEYPVFDSLRSEEVLVCELVWLSGAFGHTWDSSSDPLLIDRAENRKALEYLIELKQAGLLNPYSLNAGEMFSAEVFTWGDALFTTNWTFLIGRLEEASSNGSGAPVFNFRVSPLPYSRPIGSSSTVSGFQGLAVMKNSTQKTNAWRFISYLSSPDFQRRYLHEFPVWREVWSEPDTLRRDRYFDVKRIQVRGAKVRPVYPRYQEVSAIIRKWVFAALEEKLSVGEAFRSIQREIREIGL
ncbi:extracellular solute-binding protein [Marispirochaeta sp.]|uniref:extracellular solute-binding protein n=1 Tax=Marispirochaeta sp. TaxID=2038653 RepID=UPI0029C60434|nr:extracellular solute-binding protein [Marispirochaeta sp.]